MAKRAMDRGLRGIYLAFNRSVAADAKTSFPSCVDCRTSHSLAYRYCINVGFPAGRLNTSGLWREVEGGAVARAMVLKTLQRFYQSADAEIAFKHTPHPKNVAPGQEWTPEDAFAARDEALVSAAKIWVNQSDPGGWLPLDGDSYLKVWSLGAPRLPVDFIMVDEAQDSNPALLALFERQQCALTLIGDPHQAIYTWRGAIDAIKRIDGVEARLS
jgi:hypothetical protein